MTVALPRDGIVKGCDVGKDDFRVMAQFDGRFERLEVSADGSVADMPLGDGGFLLLPLRWFRVSLGATTIDLPLPGGAFLFPLLFELGHVVVGQAHHPVVAQNSDEVVQVDAGAFEMAGCPIRASKVVDKGVTEFREDQRVIVGGLRQQVSNLGGAEQDIQDGLTIGGQFGGEGALALADSGELILRYPV